MKIPSLFRIPRYQRFSIEPRYYDPIKEEIEARARLTREEPEPEDARTPAVRRPSDIAGAFTGHSRRKDGSATITQLIIMLLLGVAVFGYLYLGNVALYLSGTLTTVLVYLKIKRII